MKRALLTFSLLLLLLTHVAGQAPVGQPKPAPSSKEDEGIRNVLASFIEAWNKHDAKAFSMVFAEHADFTNVRGTSVHGRTEIEKFHAPFFATRFKVRIRS